MASSDGDGEQLIHEMVDDGASSPGRPRRRGHQLGGLSVLGWVLILSSITVNAGVAIYLSRSDVGSVVFVVSAYFNLVGLFVSVALFVKAPPGPDAEALRKRLKLAVWMLSTWLTFQYAYKVTGGMKPTMNEALLMWTMPAATGAAVLYVFLHKGKG